MKQLLLLALLATAELHAQTTNQLTLYFIPSPKGMDWSTPKKLAWSALQNRLSFQSHFMGHVFVGLECGEKKELTGQVGKNFDYLTQLLLHQRGLGILYHSFDGALEDRADVEEELKELTKVEGRLNFVGFKLNEAQCSRALKYLTEYRAKNVGRHYGLANRPLYGEGAGCSAFGASFAEVTGVLNTELKDAWSQSVDIPLAFAGPPLKDQGVSLTTVMLNAERWAKPEEPHQTLMFWDPDRMYNWVAQKIPKAELEKQFLVTELGKARGIIFDKSYLPVPEGSIWQQHLDTGLRPGNK